MNGSEFHRGQRVKANALFVLSEAGNDYYQVESDRIGLKLTILVDSKCQRV
jgi:hypothetical protein